MAADSADPCLSVDLPRQAKGEIQVLNPSRRGISSKKRPGTGITCCCPRPHDRHPAERIPRALVAGRQFQQGYGQRCQNARNNQGRRLALRRFTGGPTQFNRTHVRVTVQLRIAHTRFAYQRSSLVLSTRRVLRCHSRAYCTRRSALPGGRALVRCTPAFLISKIITLWPEISPQPDPASGAPHPFSPKRRLNFSVFRPHSEIFSYGSVCRAKSVVQLNGVCWRRMVRDDV